MATLTRRGAAPISHEMTSTTFDVPGYYVVQSLGLVRGIVVRSRSIVGQFGAGVQMFFGGNITIFTSMCELARENAYDIMLGQAQHLGANAVIGVRYDATEVMRGATEVLCYGTAVVVEEAPPPDHA
jgi:uncharacterized protein YbjQ (UPF0145 family)